MIKKGQGILNHKEGLQKFNLTRHQPAAELREYVKHYWIVRWDLRDAPAYEQAVLSHPNVNMVFEAGHAEIYGVSSKISSHVIAGQGAVFGVKFMSGGFYPLWGRPLSKLLDRSMPAQELFGDRTADMAIQIHKLLAEPEANEPAISLVDGLISSQITTMDPQGQLVNDIVRLIKESRELTRVEAVAQLAGLSIRSLQRLFNRYIGVGPKWVIQRYRLHEAAEQMESGKLPDWSEITADLGYYDQAHFIRDFKAIVGKPPLGYLKHGKRAPDNERR